jgi:hypothetical protein
VRTTSLPIVGVELGARMENTAISVTERVYLPTGERFTDVSYHDPESLRAREKVAVDYRVRLLERCSPPVLYKGVAERVAELVGALGECVVAMDLTRTGRPVHALIMGAVNEATKDTWASISQCPITVTGSTGRSPTVRMWGGSCPGATSYLQHSSSSSRSSSR